MKLRDKKKLYEVKLHKNFHDFDKLEYLLTKLYITDINVKKGTYDIHLNHKFSFWYAGDEEGDHILYQLAEDNIVFFQPPTEDKEGFWTWHLCRPSEKEFQDSELLDPYTVTINNLVLLDADLEKSYISISPYSKKFGDLNNAIRVQKTKEQSLKINNYYNLRSFPFDKQIIKFQIRDDVFGIKARIMSYRLPIFESLERFMKIDDISGWNKRNYEINHWIDKKIGMVEGSSYNSGIEVLITLERKVGYYLFKVIFPIILILMICWSVVWIHPRELESRLTITIVCLLSLIAYNFVIDAELPKLEYLTVLDWIILISYVYAAIPNFLTIASFKFIKTNEQLSMKLESYGKKYGPTSYVGIIIFIILLNANLNPENSGALISWMAGR